MHSSIPVERELLRITDLYELPDSRAVSAVLAYLQQIGGGFALEGRTTRVLRAFNLSRQTIGSAIIGLVLHTNNYCATKC